MVRIKEFKNRKQAEAASSYLMSKGIPSVIKGYTHVPKALEHLKEDIIELSVPEHLYDKAGEFLAVYERRINDNEK